ncbi:toxin C-terminal domain-containing protein [Selenomonas ruminantium]|uniref:Novel toxin 21 domain-containing protein n=1 Tax=Selenomonas ruminantium TaxID=971 RepID=A0A1H0U244_SELRU|nr:toxin C-terminal domain-containing protein [Selenomonas ruminantium]SDP60259.1 protein of unknown function [Selenomonas ruminantium]
MADEYMTCYHFTQCSFGSREEYINLPVDHGVTAMTTGQPLLNANDHKYEGPERNIHGYRFCQRIGVCKPKTPKVWLKTANKHLIEGAPALTEQSELMCMHGGVITFCGPPADVQAKMKEQEAYSDEGMDEDSQSLKQPSNSVNENSMKKGALNDKRSGSSKDYDKAAKELGYERIGERSHGQPIYKKGHNFITPDVNRHNGGFWKMAKSVDALKNRTSRKGTYDKHLNRIGD